MEFQVLGPLRVRVQDQWTELTAPKQRAILGVLLVNANRVVSFDRVLEEVWGERQLNAGLRALRYQVSKLRDSLEPGRARGEGSVIGTESGGYVLRVDDREFDVNRFERLAAEGATALVARRVSVARTALAEAVGLWRGDAYADFRYEQFAQSEIARLEEARLVCLENRLAADLDLGGHRTVLAELREVTARYPLREELWGHLMVALYRSGQQSEALRAYRTARRVLGEALGVEPSEALRHLEEQVLLHELPFEALHAVARDRLSLPARIQSFVGRTEGARLVEKALDRQRLVTLTGFGGVGKTSLALEVARRVAAGYPDGAGLVELAPLTDPSHVVSEFTTALGVREHPTRPALEAMVDELAPRQMLLVVDNCEHLVEEAGRVVGALLAGCPRLRVLATSRKPLRIDGEQVWPVPPLDLPSLSVEPSVTAARESDAVRLFVERAQQIHPDFELVESNVDEVVTLCRRLDGVPLALELAAARLRVLSPGQVVQRLDDRFALLSDEGPRASRHRSLRAAIDWSYDLLEPPEQLLLRRLAAFEGTFTLPAVEDVCSGDGIDQRDVLGVLSRLVDASLVTVAVTAPGQRRFGLLESVREFAQAELADSGEERVIRLRHANHFVALIPKEVIYDSAEFTKTLDIFAREQGNYRSALAWAIRVEDAERALQLGSRLGKQWVFRGMREETLSWLPRVLEASESLGTADRAFVLGDLGHALAYSSKRRESLPIIEELADLTSRLDNAVLSTVTCIAEAAFLDADSRPRDAITVIVQHVDVLRNVRHPELTNLLRNAAWASVLVGDYEEAVRYLDELEACGREFDQPLALAGALANRGMLAHYRGDLNTADRLLAESLGELRRLHRVDAEANVLREIAQVSLTTGRFGRAAAQARELIDNGRRNLIARDMAEGHVLLARAHLGAGKLELSADAARKALRIALDSDDTWALALLAATVAQIAWEMGDPPSAATLHAAAETLRSRIGFSLPKARRREIEDEFNAIRTVLGADRFHHAWNTGVSGNRTELAVTIRHVLRSDAVGSAVT